MIDADLPLLIGNTTLKKGLAVLDFGNCKLELLGKVLNLTETKSGHYSVTVKPSQCTSTMTVNDTVCLAMSAMGELTEKEVLKLHHQWGDCRVEKLGTLIRNAGKMTQSVQKHLETVRRTCESCRVIKNRVPRQLVSIPRAVRRNQIVTLDLKEWDDGRYILYLIDF
jgi:hypothetical protein